MRLGDSSGSTPRSDVRSFALSEWAIVSLPCPGASHLANNGSRDPRSSLLATVRDCSARGVAIMNTRSRKCGARTAAAGTQSHRESYPISARRPCTVPNPIERWPDTFSMIAYRGRSWRMASATQGKRCLGSSSPFLCPAWLKGWQGYPPQRTSGLVMSFQFTSLMFPMFGTSGQCFLSTRQAYGSISQFQITFIPARFRPRSRPPIPEKREPTVSVIGLPVIVEW